MNLARLILDYVKAVIWPITVLVLTLLFRREIKKALGRLRKAGFPGGISVDLQEEVQEVQALSDKVESTPTPPERRVRASIPLTDANARMLSLGLTPTQSGLDIAYYRNIAEAEPVLALAGLRIEFETLARNLAKGFKLTVGPRDSVNRILSGLNNVGAITSDQLKLAQRVLRLCNQAIHGSPVSRRQAEDVISAVEVLFRDYLAWLSWGFEDSWKPNANS